MSSNKTSRERRNFSTTGGWRRDHDSPNWPNYTSNTLRYSVPWNNTVVYGPNVIGWRAKMRAGQNVSTTLEGVRGTCRAGFGSGTAESTNPPGVGHYEAYFQGLANNQAALNPYSLPSGGLTPPTQSATTQAMIAFTHNYRQKTTQFQTGIFVGELMETVRQLASPAKALRTGIDDLYTRMIRVAGRRPSRLLTAREKRNYADAIAGTWLEWKFGVEQTIRDVDDASRAFRAMANGRCFDIVRIVGQGKAAVATETHIPFTPGTAGWPSDANYRSSLTIKKSTTVDIRGAWKNENPSGDMPLPMTFGTTVSDIVPTAWELIPWSFFVDYFTNIGDVLDAWSMRFINFEWLNITTRQRHEYISRPPPANYTGSYRYAVQCSVTHVSRWDVSRAPMLNNQWNPSLSVKIPGLGSTRWLNIAALAQMARPIH